MRLAISNIAWGPEADDAIAPALRAAGAEAIEVAPPRVFADPAAATPAQAQAVAARWAREGLPVVSMQALLFGRPELRLFGEAAEVEALAGYLERIVGLAGALGCGPLVFGSPRNRLRGARTPAAARAEAAPVFRRIGAAAAAAGCVFCLEANAEGYGCDFLTTVAEAAAMAREADHPGVGLVVDTGNMQMAGEAPDAIVPALPLMRHLHLSMPHLGPVGPDCGFLRDTLALARAGGYRGVATVEMRRPEDGDAAAAARTALAAARAWMDAT